MEQHIPQEKVRRIIISDMVKKRNSIVPVIGEDTIVYKNGMLPTRCVYQVFGQTVDGSKWLSCEDWLLTFLLLNNCNEYCAKGLRNFLKENEKKLFVLDCNLHNWLFRFLWQPTQMGRNNNMKTTLDYWINKEKPVDCLIESKTKCA